MTTIDDIAAAGLPHSHHSRNATPPPIVTRPRPIRRGTRTDHPTRKNRSWPRRDPRVVPVIEAEARVAWRFGKRRRGVLGLVSRLGWNVGYGELAPLPQLGLLLGVTTL